MSKTKNTVDKQELTPIYVFKGDAEKLHNLADELSDTIQVKDIIAKTLERAENEHSRT